jgi:vancomycin resistance protein YoaR
LNKRRHLDTGDLPADDGLPVEDMPTRPMALPSTPAPRPASGSPPQWAPRANEIAWSPRGSTPRSGAAPVPPAPAPTESGGATPGTPYIPARPRTGPTPTPPRTGWVPPEHLESLDAAPARPRGAGPPQVAAPQAAASQTRRGGVLGWIVGVVLGLVVLVLAGAVALGGWYEGQYSGRIYPGVRVLGTDLGGQTQDQARETLGAQIDAFVKQPVVLAWGDKTWQPTPEQLGLTVNLDRTIDRAFAVGRAGDLPANWRERLDARNNGTTVPLVVGMDQATLQAYLETEVAPQINQPLVEGEVWLQGEQIHTTPAQEGRELRVYDALTAVTNGLAYLTTNRIELPVTVTQPVVSAAEVDQANRQLQTYLSGPFVAHAAGKEFTLQGKDISKLITLAHNTDPAAPQHYTVTWNDAKMHDVALDWSTDIDHGAQSARFDWNNGQLTVIKESEQGVQLLITDTIQVMKDALNTIDKRTVDLPVQILEPKVSSKDIDKLQIKQEIGHGVSTFQGSSESRATNIRVGAAFLNGAVIAPGETFSILDTIAPITLDRGYVEGYVIAAERTQKGVGGGTCQVSTTTFRAAFWAGLDITERNAHAYRVGVYEALGEPVGFDAAVFDPGVDLKFRNNSPGYVLIKTSTANNELNVWFYGTPLADEVKLTGPQISNRVAPPPDVYQLDPNLPAGGKRQVETAREGLDVTIGRQIIKDGQVVSEDSFFSHFEAWPTL